MKEVIENYKTQIKTIDKEFIYMLSRRSELINQIKKINRDFGNNDNEFIDYSELFEEGLYRGINKDLIKKIWKIIEKG